MYWRWVSLFFFFFSEEKLAISEAVHIHMAEIFQLYMLGRKCMKTEKYSQNKKNYNIWQDIFRVYTFKYTNTSRGYLKVYTYIRIMIPWGSLLQNFPQNYYYCLHTMCVYVCICRGHAAHIRELLDEKNFSVSPTSCVCLLLTLDKTRENVHFMSCIESTRMLQ